jgi:hypothetical protein
VSASSYDIQTLPALTRAIVDMLQCRGAWCFVLDRCPTPRLAPRILACYEGRFLAIEVKAPRGPGPTQAQRSTLEALDQSGAITLVARSVCEVEAIIDDLRRNPPEVVMLERLVG